MDVEPKFDRFMDQFSAYLMRWDEERQKADEDRRKADERFKQVLDRLEKNDQRIEKLIAKSDRRERDLALGLAKIGKKVLDKQDAAQKLLEALLKQLRFYGNGRWRGGKGPQHN